MLNANKFKILIRSSGLKNRFKDFTKLFLLYFKSNKTLYTMMLTKLKTVLLGDEGQKSFQNNPNLLHGDWKFKGYFPKDCKPLPSCHTKHL